METLSLQGQKPEIMVVACCDSRVDPALILQCDPGDLFVVRNVANIVPPYENDNSHHGTSAALEFATCFLKVKHIILLGHSQCGGIAARLENDSSKNDFITNWVSIIKTTDMDIDTCAKSALHQSYKNCLGFPWIYERMEQKTLMIHRWFFDIKAGEIFEYLEHKGIYQPLAKRDD
jgi:carbonic anhydrase